MALDTSVLDTLFEDDWKNLYKDLHVTDTVAYGCSHQNNNCCGNSNQVNTAILEDILTRQDDFEDKLATIDKIGEIGDLTSIIKDVKDVSTRVKTSESKIADINSSVSDISTKIQSMNREISEISKTSNDISANQQEIENFLNSILHWENKNGTVI